MFELIIIVALFGADPCEHGCAYSGTPPSRPFIRNDVVRVTKFSNEDLCRQAGIKLTTKGGSFEYKKHDCIKVE